MINHFGPVDMFYFIANVQHEDSTRTCWSLKNVKRASSHVLRKQACHSTSALSPDLWKLKSSLLYDEDCVLGSHWHFVFVNNTVAWEKYSYSLLKTHMLQSSVKLLSTFKTAKMFWWWVKEAILIRRKGKYENKVG